MKRDVYYVKGHRLRMEEISSCQLSGSDASFSLFLFLFLSDSITICFDKTASSTLKNVFS